MTHLWERERARRKHRRQVLRWLTLAAGLLALLIWLLVSAPVVRDTEAQSGTVAQHGGVERVVEQEARGESYLGQMAVAQCIRQAAEDDGLTPYEVVMQDGQYADPALSASDSVKAAVQAVLYDGEDAVAAAIRYFYAPDINGESSWHESQLEYVCDIGNHRFFAERGDDNG